MIGKTARGFLFGAVAAAAYGTNPLFAMPLYARGLTPDQVLFLRYLAAIPVVGLLALARRQPFAVGRRQLLLLVGLGLVVAFSSLALFMSYRFMDVGVASTLLFVYPVMVAVIMAALFGERLSRLKMAAIAAAMTGIALLGAGDASGRPVSMAGLLLVMGSALSYAVYIVAVNRTSLARVPTLIITFYALLFGVALFAARIPWGGAEVVWHPDDPMVWGCVAGLALLPTAISFACTNLAIADIGSTNTAILGALEPATAVLIGVGVFGEELSPRIVIGLLVIIGAVTAVAAGPGLGTVMVRVRRLFPRPRRRR